MNMEKLERLRESELNCSQQVVAYFLGEDEANKAIGFGGGIGGLRMTCGAITGGIMVMSKFYKDAGMEKADIYEEVRNFVKKIEKEMGSSACMEILGVPFAEAPATDYMKMTKCNKVIEKVIQYIDDVIS